MEYASNSAQSLGLLTAAFNGALAITSSVLLLRERTFGAWLMLAGGILALIGTVVPQSIYIFVGWYSAADLSPQVENLMYLSIWDWLSLSAWFLFFIGLLLVTLRRRELSKRIAELESQLSIRDSEIR